MRLSSPPDLWTLLWIVLLFNAMGCIQSIRCKPKSFRDSIIVLEVNSSIDPNPTSIDESSSVVLRYRTPHFRACARVLVPPVAGKETWTIGWIQACNHMEFYNTYGNKGMWVRALVLNFLFCFTVLSRSSLLGDGHVFSTFGCGSYRGWMRNIRLYVWNIQHHRSKTQKY